jgi:hypothetical protein
VFAFATNELSFSTLKTNFENMNNNIDNKNSYNNGFNNSNNDTTERIYFYSENTCAKEKMKQNCNRWLVQFLFYFCHFIFDRSNLLNIFNMKYPKIKSVKVFFFLIFFVLKSRFNFHEAFTLYWLIILRYKIYIILYT